MVAGNLLPTAAFFSFSLIHVLINVSFGIVLNAAYLMVKLMIGVHSHASFLTAQPRTHLILFSKGHYNLIVVYSIPELKSCLAALYYNSHETSGVVFFCQHNKHLKL